LSPCHSCLVSPCHRPLIWKGLVKPPNKVLKNKIGYLSQVILHELPEKIRT